jgi:hypothetical protein
MHARSNWVHADAVHGFTEDGHVQSLTQHAVPAPHWSGFAAQELDADDPVEQPTWSDAKRRDAPRRAA